MSIPQEELTLRWTKLQEAMAREDLDGLLVFANPLKTAALHYVANYTLIGSRACCYLAPAGPPVLLISEPWDLERARGESPINDIRVLGRDWPQELTACCGSRSGQLGLAGREIMGRQDLQALETALGRETVSASRLMEDLATIKSHYERALIRAAAGMADAGFMRALAVMRLGLPDYELGAEIDYAMRRMGATDNFQMLAVGKQNTGMLLPIGKKVERGDLILFEITPESGSETYAAQLCRTAICGASPDALLQEKYHLLREALETSLSIIRPGVMIGEVARLQNKIIEKAGYGE
ncbi:MAG: M24 family metallopeptidase, partial [Deltaproteobacteria bacterium]|nr:M24 family metallopeptidase [Deltaproteobacteria bacterium]